MPCPSQSKLAAVGWAVGEAGADEAEQGGSSVWPVHTLLCFQLCMCMTLQAHSARLLSNLHFSSISLQRNPNDIRQICVCVICD